MFKPGDRVMCEDKGPYILERNNSSDYPLVINGIDSFTLDGRQTMTGPVKLTLIENENVKTYRLGQVQTLDDGTQIYHPTNGQPFQLIPNTKALLC